MVIGGLLTTVQGKRVAGIGGGTLSVMGASGASIGVGVLALVAGVDTAPPLVGPTLAAGNETCATAELPSPR